MKDQQNTQKKQSTTIATSTDNKELNSELVKREEIKDSPFLVIEVEGKAFGAFGIYRITDEYKTKEEVIEALKPMTWNRIIQIVSIINEMLNGKKQ